MNALLMPFIDESETYTLGVEIGMLWMMVESADEIVGHPVHVKNVAQIWLLADAFGIDIEITPSCDTWSLLTVNKFQP